MLQNLLRGAGFNHDTSVFRTTEKDFHREMSLKDVSVAQRLASVLFSLLACVHFWIFLQRGTDQRSIFLGIILVYISFNYVFGTQAAFYFKIPSYTWTWRDTD